LPIWLALRGLHRRLVAKENQDIMTDTPTSVEPDESSTEFQISFRDDATQADRENAERSVAALVARSVAAVARNRAAEAELAELTDSLTRPFVNLIEQDPLANKALEKLRAHQLAQPDAIDMLRQDTPFTLTYDAISSGRKML
jgi:hypothetical protein